MRTVLGEVSICEPSVVTILTSPYAANRDKLEVCEHGCSSFGRFSRKPQREALKNH